MAETIFTEVRYTVNQLVNYIEMGEIGLPDIQRPFVWKNTKVRDLLDSLYRGYPVGYLLFWQNADIENFGRNIGSHVGTLDSVAKHTSNPLTCGGEKFFIPRGPPRLASVSVFVSVPRCHLPK